MTLADYFCRPSGGTGERRRHGEDEDDAENARDEGHKAKHGRSGGHKSGGGGGRGRQAGRHIPGISFERIYPDLSISCLPCLGLGLD